MKGVCRRARPWRLAALLACVSIILALPARGSSRSPSVLVHCARSSPILQRWCVDREYLAELHRGGFEVDYTDVHSDLTWDRLRRYDVLVTYVTPLEHGRYFDNTPDRPPYRDAFVALVERFLDHGGGVFLMARSINGDRSFRPLIERWGARIPQERVEETDPERLASLPRMGAKQRLWFVDDVRPTPVSTGVEQVWLPLASYYSANQTMPIHVSDAWQVVLAGASSSRTEPIEEQGARVPLPADRFLREDPSLPPDLFAIREYGRGRIAFCAIWPQFSIGQGTRWLYERRVLSLGVGDRPSGFGRLIENTLRWLAEPEGTGGFVTVPERLLAPNLRPGATDAFLAAHAETRVDPERVLRLARRGKRPYRGLIGARSESGGGAGDVAAWAASARRSGLDFVVFLEDFSELDDGDLERLAAECLARSSDGLRLYAGYRLDTNTGNRFFLFGPSVERPPPALMIDRRLNLQPQDPQSGRFTGEWPGVIDWLAHGQMLSRQTNFGYFEFSAREGALRVEDLRLYGMVAVDLYRDGRRLEDNLDALLASAAGTLPAVPVAVHLVDSPVELERAATEGLGLTGVAAPSLDGLWAALRYARQYRAPGVFASDGPEIVAWPGVHQYYTLGAEDFVGKAAYAAVPLVVRSERGLKEVRVYDGDRLVRRFDGAGEAELARVLELSDSIQRTLTVVARDRAGRRAVGTARRNWKGGEQAPIFCGDRINHCDSAPMMARGPGAIRRWWTPAIDVGASWDGGPDGRRPLVQDRRPIGPVLVSNRGTEGERGFANVPRLLAGDEGAVRVGSLLAMRYEGRVPVNSAWSTWGPLAGPSRLMRAELRFTQFDRPTGGVDPERHLGFRVAMGAAVSLLEQEMVFLQRQSVRELTWLTAAVDRTATGGRLLHGRRTEILERYPLRRRMPERVRLTLDSGEWIAFVAEEGFNPLLQINRGSPLAIEVDRGGRIVYRAASGLSGVRPDEHVRSAVLSVVDPLDAKPWDEARVLAIVGFLDGPAGLERVGPDGVGIPLRPTRGLLELGTDSEPVTLRLPHDGDSTAVPLPVRLSGLRPRWSAGLFLHRGYVAGRYGAGSDRYRALAVDAEGNAHAALYPDLAERTEVTLGHPVVCDRDELAIQVTLREDRPAENAWHVSVHNPTARQIRTEVRVMIPMPGLPAARHRVVVPAGATVVIR